MKQILSIALILYLIFRSQSIFAQKPDFPVSVEVLKTYLMIHVSNLPEGKTVEMKCRYQIFPDMKDYYAKPITISQESDYLVSIDTRAADTYFLEFDKKERVFFLVPNDTLHLYWNVDENSTSFQGKYAAPNQYFVDSEKKFGHRFLLKGIMFNNIKLNFNEYARKADSLFAAEIDYLKNYEETNHLPSWFVEMERTNLLENYVHSKAVRPQYLKRFYEYQEEVPANYFYFLNDKKTMQFGFIPACYVIEDIFSMLVNNGPGKEMNLDKRSIDTLKSDLRSIHGLASQYVKEDLLESVLLYWCLSRIKYSKKLELIDIYGEMLESYFPKSKYVEIFRQVAESKRIQLKRNDWAPNFYLVDRDGKEYTLHDFKGKVRLINFWIPGCHPCIEQIPYEKELVEKYKDKDFVLLNICLEADKNTWLRCIQKYKMTKGAHLATQGNWDQLLKERYLISGFPHYVLIDAEGKIFENKCVKPNELLQSSIIDRLLPKSKSSIGTNLLMYSIICFSIISLVVAAILSKNIFFKKSTNLFSLAVSLKFTKTKNK